MTHTHIAIDGAGICDVLIDITRTENRKYVWLGCQTYTKTSSNSELLLRRRFCSFLLNRKICFSRCWPLEQCLSNYRQQIQNESFFYHCFKNQWTISYCSRCVRLNLFDATKHRYPSFHHLQRIWEFIFEHSSYFLSDTEKMKETITHRS